MAKACHIVGAGEETALAFITGADDLIIGCDGGYSYLLKYGYKPDVIIGDFDSLGFVPEGENVIKLNPIKDDTDVIAALKYADKLGYDTFFLHCCLGNDISHTLSNLQILTKLATDKKQAYLMGADVIITAIKDGELIFSGENLSGFISVFSPDVSYGVTLKGLKYPLKNYTMKNTYPIGVSNEFTGVSASVSVKNGTLIVIFPSNIALPRAENGSAKE